MAIEITIGLVSFFVGGTVAWFARNSAIKKIQSEGEKVLQELKQNNDFIQHQNGKIEDFEELHTKKDVEISKKDVEIEKRDAKIEELKLTIEGGESTVSTLTKHITEIEKQVADLKETNELKNQTIIDLQNSLTIIEKAIDENKRMQSDVFEDLSKFFAVLKVAQLSKEELVKLLSNATPQNIDRLTIAEKAIEYFEAKGIIEGLEKIG